MFHCRICQGLGEIFAGYGAGYCPWDVVDILEPCKTCSGKGKTWKFWHMSWRYWFSELKRWLVIAVEEEDIPF